MVLHIVSALRVEQSFQIITFIDVRWRSASIVPKNIKSKDKICILIRSSKDLASTSKNIGLQPRDEQFEWRSCTSIPPLDSFSQMAESD